MKISVCFAVPAEAVAFQRLLKGRTGSVRIFFTGIGMETARLRTTAHLKKMRPDFLICAGFAGGLHPNQKIGDVVVGENVSSKVWAAPGCRLGKIHTTTDVVSIAEERQVLASESGALAVDMESEAVFGVAESKAVPIFTIRSISDIPGKPIPVPLEVSYDLRRQCTKPVTLLIWLVRHPTSILPFIAFLKNLRTARESLATALLQTVDHLLSEASESAL